MESCRNRAARLLTHPTGSCMTGLCRASQERQTAFLRRYRHGLCALEPDTHPFGQQLHDHAPCIVPVPHIFQAGIAESDDKPTVPAHAGSLAGRLPAEPDQPGYSLFPEGSASATAGGASGATSAGTSASTPSSASICSAV